MCMTYFSPMTSMISPPLVPTSTLSPSSCSHTDLSWGLNELVEEIVMSIYLSISRLLDHIITFPSFPPVINPFPLGLSLIAVHCLSWASYYFPIFLPFHDTNFPLNIPVMRLFPLNAEHRIDFLLILPHPVPFLDLMTPFSKVRKTTFLSPVMTI